MTAKPHTISIIYFKINSRNIFLFRLKLQFTQLAGQILLAYFGEKCGLG